MTKKSLPTTAIITRTKDRPFFLARALESVDRQSVKDYVHVVLNDGGSQKEVESLLRQYPNKNRLVIHNKKSVGITKALNQAVRSVDSRYIAILDDDDSWHKDRLKLALKTMQKYKAKASVVPMSVVIEDVKNDKIIRLSEENHPESWCGEVSLFKQMHRNYLSNGAVMYERQIFNELGGYDESLPVAEDWDFGIRLMLKYNVEQVISNKALVYYHQRPAVKDAKIGNSVHAGVREQERAIMLMRNNYLRKDIERGVFGVGYIMNHSEQELINLVRVEGHINRTADRISQEFNKINQLIIKPQSWLKRAVKKLK